MMKIFEHTVYRILTALIVAAVVACAKALGQTCQGISSANGFEFQLPDNVTEYTRQPHCELMLDIEGHNRAVYENGMAPVSIRFPVVGATMDNFTLAICPLSVVLDIACQFTDNEFHRQILKKMHCSCVNSTGSPISKLTTSTSTKDHHRAHVGIYITIALSVMVILGLWSCTLRKKTVTHGDQHDNVSSSAKSSTGASQSQEIGMMP